MHSNEMIPGHGSRRSELFDSLPERHTGDLVVFDACSKRGVCL